MVLTKDLRDELWNVQRLGGQLADAGMTTPGDFELRIDAGKWLQLAQGRVTSTP